MTEVVFHLEELFESLYKATLAIASADKLNTVLQQIANSARELVGANYAAIGIVDDKGKLTSLITSGIDGEFSGEDTNPPVGMGVLGRLIKEKKPIRISKIGEDPHSVGFPKGHPQMDSFLGVPIMENTSIFGNLYLTNKYGAGDFTEIDQKLVELLAAHAAIAIRKAKLLESHERYSSQLEKRTGQLAALNRATMAITSELTLEKVLQQIVDSLRDLANAEFSALGVPNADGGLDTFVYSGMAAEDVSKMPHFPKGLGLLGAIIREKRAIRIANVAGDPRSVGFPSGHPEMTSFMGVPVVAGGQVLGNVYLTNKVGALEFSSDDQDLVEMLAANAAIVIQNSRLYEQVGRLAIIAERARIGMDLHDGVIQSIYAVGLTLESVKLSLPEEEKGDADELLDHAIQGLNDTIRDIRNFILDLRPHRFSGDLRDGLSRLVREFQANTMVPVELKMSLGGKFPLPGPIARAIFLTMQEALANIARHARASQVVVDAKSTDNEIVLIVKDNGKGFDTKAQVQTVGHGLSNMRARAETLKGSFSLKSTPGQGTNIRLVIPFR